MDKQVSWVGAPRAGVAGGGYVLLFSFYPRQCSFAIGVLIVCVRFDSV
jgi:hypothetical protein